MRDQETRSEWLHYTGECIVGPLAGSTLPMLDGLVVDFRKEGLNELFKFDNPNAEALCGCGESFALKKPA